MIYRYQPEMFSHTYHIANTQEEMEMSETISMPSMGILPGVEERFSFRMMLFPDITEPSNLSGFTVNVCTSLLGMNQCDSALRQMLVLLVLFHFVQLFCGGFQSVFVPGLLILTFSLLAVQGGSAVWNIVTLGVLFGLCVILTFIIWRQPESKTKLSFKVRSGGVIQIHI